MGNITFGIALKSLREKAGISTKELSKLIDKAPAYVSQIETGKIKKTNYPIAYALLKNVGIKEDIIEGMLGSFGITSPDKEVEQYIETNEQLWLNQRNEKLKATNKQIGKFFDLFIDKDYSKAKQVIDTIYILTCDEENFEFFTSLLEYDYEKISENDRKRLLEIIDDFIKSLRM